MSREEREEHPSDWVTLGNWIKSLNTRSGTVSKVPLRQYWGPTISLDAGLENTGQNVEVRRYSVLLHSSIRKHNRRVGCCHSVGCRVDCGSVYDSICGRDVCSECKGSNPLAGPGYAWAALGVRPDHEGLIRGCLGLLQGLVGCCSNASL
jgi:hypothetical protein